MVSAPTLIMFGLNKYKHKLWMVFKVAFTSKELNSYNYSLTTFNIEYLIQVCSIIANESYDTCSTYYHELINNAELKEYFQGIKSDNFDSRFEFSGRILNYILIRSLKPKLVIENGVARGVNTILMCEALAKNRFEGQDEIAFLGLDINPNCGEFVKNRHYDFCDFVIGDAIEFLKKHDVNIDYYFSDGCRTIEYEKEEFALLEPKMASNGVVVTNKGGFSNMLSQLAIKTGHGYMSFMEEVANHWYPGSNFGIMYQRQKTETNT